MQIITNYETLDTLWHFLQWSHTDKSFQQYQMDKKLSDNNYTIKALAQGTYNRHTV